MLEEYNLRDLLEQRGQSYATNPIVKLIKKIEADYGFQFNVHEGPWIAGGSVRKLLLGQELGEFSDIDLFFPNQNSFDTFMRLQGRFGKRRGRSEEYKSTHAYTFKFPDIGKVQLIKRQFYDSPHELLGDFDFTIIQLVTDGEKLLCVPNAIEHNDKKVFDFYNVRENSDIIGRFFKYCARGYTPLPGVTTRLHQVVKHNPYPFRKKGY